MLLHTVIVVISLLVVIVILATIASKPDLPYAILLVIGGGLIGIIPTIPDVELAPDLVLILFLPPLVYSSAWFTSWRNFKREAMAISLMAVGLVLVTQVIVAIVAHALVPGMSWAVAFVLGAVVGPTDTVAAIAIIKHLGVARRIVTIIEGESLVNDATALVAYQFAVAAAVSGTFSFWLADLQFVLVSLGGIALGLIVAWPISQVHRYLEDAPSEIILTLITPFAAYLLAERVEVSGVLAVVTAGLFLSRRSATMFSSETRLQTDSFWNVLTFLLNGLLFLLLGLQLPMVMEALATFSLSHTLLIALAICLTVVLVRLSWTFASAGIFAALAHFKVEKIRPLGWRTTLAIGWSGMRGGISLATALAIPTTLSNNTTFPDRSLLIFITFGVILFTLLIQGLSLGPLLRLLHLDNDPGVKQERHMATIEVTQAALARLDELLQEEQPIPKQYVLGLRGYYERRLNVLSQEVEMEEIEKWRKSVSSSRKMLHEIHDAQREKAIELRDTNLIDDEVFHEIEHNLDLDEQRLSGQ